MLDQIEQNGEVEFLRPREMSPQTKSNAFQVDSVLPCNCLRNKRFALDQPEQTGDVGDQYLLRVLHHSLHRLEFKLTAKGMRYQKLEQDKCSGVDVAEQNWIYVVRMYLCLYLSVYRTGCHVQDDRGVWCMMIEVFW